MRHHQDAVDEEQQVRIWCTTGARAAGANAQPPVDLPVDVSQVDRQRLAGPYERALGLGLDLRGVNAVDDAARRRDVEFDVQRRRSRVDDGEPDGAAERGEHRGGKRAPGAADHVAGSAMTSR